MCALSSADIIPPMGPHPGILHAKLYRVVLERSLADHSPVIPTPVRFAEDDAYEANGTMDSQETVDADDVDDADGSDNSVEAKEADNVDGSDDTVPTNGADSSNDKVEADVTANADDD